MRIDNLAKNQALDQVRAFLVDRGQHLIFTPNPEMLVEASQDAYFQEVLNQGSLNLCDGKGIQLVSKEKIERITGVDFLFRLCELAQAEGKSVYLLGSGSQAVVKKTQENLQKKIPQLKIIGSHPGPKITVTYQHDNTTTLKIDEEVNERALQDIIDTAPDILFVAFGHNKQEKWLYEFLPHLPSVKIAMGVGGAFDYISGKIQRAPRLLQNLGLEWLWRLIQQPKRFFRIWNATIKFLWLVYKNPKLA